ncbi:P-loop NTPase fold protein [Kocuria rhizophila]|nr:P-loop NTPase fold protein [Kocuria rhizophila]
MAAEGARIAGEELAKSPSWQAAFNKASEKLKGLKKPILVIVDDIDRLHGDELLTLLKVVRLLGRFEGIQYLLAYDDETLYRRVSTSSTITDHDGSAERFMEKLSVPAFCAPLIETPTNFPAKCGSCVRLPQKSEEASDDGRLSELLDCFTALLTTLASD